MKSKKTVLSYILSMLLVIATSTRVNAQHIELAPLIGHETGAYMQTDLGQLHVVGGLNFGGSLDVSMGGGRYVELSFTQMYTSLSYEAGVATTELTDLIIDYYSAGILQEIRPDAKVTPYGLFTLGLVNYNPSSTDYSSENKMHLSLAGGLKINASEKVGIRLQARLLLPIVYYGGYLFAGTGGAGYAVSGGFRGVQGDFTAQLVLKLGQ